MAPHSKAILKAMPIDSEVIVFLPPSYAHDKKRRYPVVYALHGFSSAQNSGLPKFTCRRPLKARLRKGRGS